MLPDFQLKENGVPQTITVSQITTTVPISVALLLDNTTSVQGQLSTIEAASISFVEMLTVNDEASIIKFAQFPELMSDFTSTTADLITAITTTPTQLGLLNETRLYDALGYAVGQTAPRLNQKAIVLVSDGKDETYQGLPNASVNFTMDTVIAYATQNHVAIYTVGLGNVDAGVMNSLASETGGQYYYITTADQLPGVYQAISNILFGQYSIQYVSSLHGSNPIMLEIDVVNGADTGTGTLQVIGCP
jgi:VWFA-related protein